jgi:hypothetical protein
MLTRVAPGAGLLLGLAVLTSAARADEDAVANAKARTEAARKVYDGMLAKAKTFGDPADPEKLYRWSRRWMEAECDTTDKKTDHVAAAEAHLDRMKKREALARELAKTGQIGPVEVAAAEYYRLKAEQTLARTKK